MGSESRLGLRISKSEVKGERTMRRRGFTLVELLVVIAIIALLVGILMPTLARVKQLAQQLVCSTNLANIGKAMMVYANDYEDEYPIAGGGQAVWSTNGEVGLSWYDADIGNLGLIFKPGIAAEATITSSFYYLVKYADMTTKTFVCRGDVDTKAFRLSDGTPVLTPPTDFDLEDVWDFGQTNIPGRFCSYSMHMPYYIGVKQSGYPINSTSHTGSPLCADRNPYLDKNAIVYLEDDDIPWEEWKTFSGSVKQYYDVAKKSNSASHGRQGQNVLYNDAHVDFEKYPNVGRQNDNIWKFWTETPSPSIEERQLGAVAFWPGRLSKNQIGQVYPQATTDAFLVNEYNAAQ